MGVDGRAAAQAMLRFGTWRKGHCLEAVWAAFKAVGARATTTAPTATVGWERSAGKHHGDRNPPAGVPVWWGPKRSSAAGDVVISLGGGRVVATDWPYNGVIGITTIDARERQIGRPYLGWTEEILGQPVDFDRPGTGSGDLYPTRPVSEEDDTMLALRINGIHLATLDVGTFSHMIKSDNPERIKDIVRGDDRWTDTTTSELPVLLRRFGCDLNIWDIRDGKFVVLDPLDNSIKEGNTWSVDNAQRSTLERIEVTSAETRRYVEKLAKIPSAA
ncbi:lysin A [Microbacterium phage Hyperion]|uniref:Lysin A n=1 Tax=Microbacterium phage Hyperion TaxID=2182354 RepID=A0A2U8UIW7_9CAUD|nr:membrane associated protein [Microbacterium phage Hyperion]AWN03560.1 lysin A [Microbacterium phage Hyperion]